jgi:hypothetical protein
MCACNASIGYVCPQHRRSELNTAARWEHGDTAGVTITNKDNLFAQNAVKVQLNEDELIQLGHDLIESGLRIKKNKKARETYRGA